MKCQNKELRDKIGDWKPNPRNIFAMPVVENDTVITPMRKMKIPAGKMAVQPYKHLKTS